MAILELTIPEDTPLVNGKQITFRTPYGSSRLNEIEIDGHIFEVLDSNNRPPSSRLFSPGSMITVVLDMDHMIAYIPSDGIRLGKDADATDTAALAATLDEIGVNAENLSVSDKVKDMLGLSNGYIDDALECIGKYNQYWWSATSTDGNDYKTEYVYSTHRNAYPDYEIVNGVLYKYLGIPFDKMVYDNEKDFKVGDLKTSARTDQSENWLLCNGDTVTKKEYPELYVLLKDNNAVKSIISDDGTELTFGATICVDGVWYGVTPAICIDSDAKTYVNKVFSTSDPVNGTWTMINQILQCTCADGNRGQYKIQDIQYENGVYFLKAYFSSSTSSSYGRWYATDPAGEWTYLHGAADSDTLGKIAYLNGLWTYAYKSQSMYYLIVKYATELTGEWTNVNPYIDLNNNGSVKGITYADGKWVVTCSHWHTSDNDYTSSVYITEDITNASSKDKWTRYDIKSEDNYQYIRATDSIKFINNIWVFIGFSGNLITTTDLSKAWTNISSGQSYIQDVLYIGDTWFVYGCYNSASNIFNNSNNNIMVSTTEDINSGLWKKYSVNTNSQYSIMISDYNYSDDGFVCVCSNDIASNDLFHLPTITQDSSYVYIKAKG